MTTSIEELIRRIEAETGGLSQELRRIETE